MGQLMTLREILEKIYDIDDDLTIYCVTPFTLESDSMLIEREECTNIYHVKNGVKIKYFLEIFLVKEMLDDFKNHPDYQGNMEKQFLGLIEYAIYDA